MPSQAALGIASFFGGMARGISGGIEKREAAKQAEKDAKNRMIWNLVDAGIQQGQDPQNLMMWGAQQTGIGGKDLSKLAITMRHASTVVPQMFDEGSSPGTSIGLGTPGGGQQPAATGPQASPGRSVALNTPVQDAVPTAPQIPTQDELTARQRADEAYKSKLQGDTEIRVGHAKAEDAAALAKTKSTKGGQVTGDDLLSSDPNAVDTNGAPVKKGKSYQAYRMGDNSWQYEPISTKPVSNALTTRAAVLKADPKNAGKSDTEINAMASQQLQGEQALKSRAALSAIAGRQTSTALSSERLALLKQVGPLTVKAAQLGLDAKTLSIAKAKAAADGDPRSQVDIINAMAAKLITDPDSGVTDFNDAADQLVHENGFGEDYQDLLVRAKQAPQPVTVPDTSGGTAGGQKPAASQPAKAGVTPPAGAAVSVMRAGKSVSVADGKYQAGDIRTYPNGTKGQWYPKGGPDGKGGWGQVGTGTGGG